MPRRLDPAPLAFLLAGGVLLGLSTNLAEVAARAGLAPLPFLAWSVLLAALALLALALARRRPPPLGARALEYYAVAAFVSVAAPNLIFVAAVPRVGAGFVALAIAFSPLLTYLGALGLGMERFDARRAFGVALALAGAAVLAARKLGAPDAPALWVGLALLGPALLAVGNLYRTLRWPPGASGEALAPGMLLAAAAMLPLAGLPSPGSLAVPLDRPGPALAILAQAATFTGQFLCLFALQRRGGPVLLSLLGAVGAVVGVPVAVLALGEAAPEGLSLAAPLIAAGVALVALDAGGVGARPGLAPRPGR